MCELFGVSSGKKVTVNEYMKEFVSHSTQHPHGWGLAVFYGNAVNLEKESIPAYKSSYLKQRLRHRLEVTNMIAHIRLATRGTMEYENSHPFVKRDSSDRAWTLAHNGTVFNGPSMEKYIYLQEGQTDSERILLYIIDRVNEMQKNKQRPLTEEERFWLMDQIVCEIAPNNKLNLLVYDGELYYVHTNYQNSLYYREQDGLVFFATVPLDNRGWKQVPFTTLLGYREGKLLFTGTTHGQEYVDNLKDLQYLFMDYAAL